MNKRRLLALPVALKAQAQSRATVEALERVANARGQTVRHVHVDNRGGQAAITHNVYTGGQRNENTDDQSHGPAIGAAGARPVLPSPDPLGNGVPIPNRELPAAMLDARRDQPRCPNGQPQRLETWWPIKRGRGGGALHQVDCAAGVQGVLAWLASGF